MAGLQDLSFLTPETLRMIAQQRQAPAQSAPQPVAQAPEQPVQQPAFSLQDQIRSLSQQAAAVQPEEAGKSQALLNAGVGALAGLVNPEGANPFARGAVNALQQFSTTRAADAVRSQERAKAQREELRARIGDLQSLSGVDVAQRAEERLQGQQDFTEEQSTLRHLVDPKTGAFVQNVFQRKDGKFVGPNGEDVTVPVFQSGLRVVNPSASQTNVTTNVVPPTTRALNEFQKKFVQRVEADAPKVAMNQAALTNAKRAEQEAATAVTGTGAESILSAKSFIKTALLATGQQDLADKIDVSSEERLRQTVPTALEPFIAAQGRSFTDQDRASAEQGLAGLRNSRDVNIYTARVTQTNALNEIDKVLFDREIAGQISTFKTDSPAASERNFNAYQRELPRSKVNEQGKYESVDDGAQLWQYYVDGRPRLWNMSGGPEGKTADFSMAEIKTIASRRGQSAREFLAQMQEQGRLTGVTR